MMELGVHSAEGHRLARDVARECGIECWVVGEQFTARMPGDRTFPNTDEVTAALLADWRKDAPHGPFS